MQACGGEPRKIPDGYGHNHKASAAGRHEEKASAWHIHHQMLERMRIKLSLCLWLVIYHHKSRQNHEDRIDGHVQNDENDALVEAKFAQKAQLRSLTDDLAVAASVVAAHGIHYRCREMHIEDHFQSCEK